MARPSRWQQFANNFNAMKGTLDTAFKQYDINKVNKQEFLDDQGNALEGDALSRARTDALAGVYEKWGDAEGALNLRAKGAELEGLMRSNRIGAATEQDQIYIQGAGARANLDSGIAANRASAGASAARARLSNLEAEGIINQRNFDNTLRGIMTEAGTMEFDSPDDENNWVTSRIRAADIPMAMKTSALTALNEFGSANLALESAAITRAANEALQGGLPTFADWYNTEIADGFQLELATDPDSGRVTAYAVTGEGDNVRRSEIASGEGDGAEMQILNSLYSQVTSPGNILGAAVDNLAYRRSQTEAAAAERGLEKTDAEIEGIRARTADTRSQTNWREGPLAEQTQAEIDNIRSQIQARGISSSLDNARIELIAEQVAQIKSELDPNRRLTQQEIDREWASFAGRMAAAGQEPDDISAMQNMFYNSLQSTDGFTVRPRN